LDAPDTFIENALIMCLGWLKCNCSKLRCSPHSYLIWMRKLHL